MGDCWGCEGVWGGGGVEVGLGGVKGECRRGGREGEGGGGGEG